MHSAHLYVMSCALNKDENKKNGIYFSQFPVKHPKSLWNMKKIYASGLLLTLWQHILFFFFLRIRTWTHANEWNSKWQLMCPISILQYIFMMTDINCQQHVCVCLSVCMCECVRVSVCVLTCLGAVFAQRICFSLPTCGKGVHDKTIQSHTLRQLYLMSTDYLLILIKMQLFKALVSKVCLQSAK